MEAAVASEITTKVRTIKESSREQGSSIKTALFLFIRGFDFPRNKFQVSPVSINEL